jgi:cytochrome c-type biogenesis protein CcmH
MRNPRVTICVGDVARVGGAAGVGSPRPTVNSVVTPMAFALACLCGAAIACEKKNEAPRPATIGSSTAPTPAAAPSAPIAPPPAAHTGVTPSAPSPGVAKASESIIGKITLSPARKADVTPTDVVYLVARRVADNPGARGSLVAVKRYTASSFPIEFTLGAGDMMFQNGAFEGELSLAARVDKDGDPMTRRKGDVFGTADRVRVGATGVEIKLDQIQKEDESLAGSSPPHAGMPSGHP